MRMYELIDATDNDSHDEGSLDEMREEAQIRNEHEWETGGNPKRWTVKPAGYSAANFKG